ncbi:MAG TPA: hypothetical protein VGR81_08180 [Candidatus Acidoferrales bacterium]|nr:hypothetical protein [Candidatus Acidoferrales bacterium]
MGLVFAGCSNKGSSASSADNASSSAGGQSAASAAPPPITIPAGKEIQARLETSLNSRDNQAGDTFEATLTDPIVVDGQTIAERDTKLRGVVVDARASGRLSKPGLLSVELRGIDIQGNWVEISTEPLTVEAKSHKKRDVIAIGGGSALGALIGGIAGGGKGAAIGALAGGGAGTAGAAATGKLDVRLSAESHLTFRLSRAIAVSQ